MGNQNVKSRTPRGRRRSNKYMFRAVDSAWGEISNMVNTDFALLYDLDLDPTTAQAGCNVTLVMVAFSRKITTKK